MVHGCRVDDRYQRSFDGQRGAGHGELRPNVDLPGMGLVLTEQDIKHFDD